MKYKPLRNRQLIKKGDEFCCTVNWRKSNMWDFKVGDSGTTYNGRPMKYRRPIKARKPRHGKSSR